VIRRAQRFDLSGFVVKREFHDDKFKWITIAEYLVLHRQLHDELVSRRLE
jgi:hypothetical protein